MVLFTNSVRGDLEAWLTRCPQRFGLVRPGKPRPLLTHAWRVPADFDERTNHELKLWENFLRHFGLAGTLDCTPLPRRLPPAGDRPVIGLIAGSENTPAKRWPVAHWRELIRRLLAAEPGVRLVLFGTAADRPVTAAVTHGFDPECVVNTAGGTDLPAFMARLRECRLLVGNDTGGMHLANALSVPVIVLFGPTNPLRTGPVFTSRHGLLQPPGCPPTGGGDLADLTPATVFDAVSRQLELASDGPSA
jgi:ADP-heptose:LPS heptosyltransferase